VWVGGDMKVRRADWRGGVAVGIEEALKMVGLISRGRVSMVSCSG